MMDVRNMLMVDTTVLNVNPGGGEHGANTLAFNAENASIGGVRKHAPSMKMLSNAVAANVPKNALWVFLDLKKANKVRYLLPRWLTGLRTH